MDNSSPLSFCISTYNNLNYLKLAISSVRKNSYFKVAPFVVHAENCTDGTNEWLLENREKYNLTLIIEPNNEEVRGIGGGMNICAEHVQTDYILFLHSDFYVQKNWDKKLYDRALQYSEEKLWVNPYRIEPAQFGPAQSRPGTYIVPMEIFGGYYHDFNQELFEQESDTFATTYSTVEFPKGEGVSGLVKKEVWDEVGGNDPIFAPASWEDMDLFIRMLQHGVRFIVTASSVVWHFGARGSHRLEENNGKTSDRQILAEEKNRKLWLEKWGKYPEFDEYGMVKLM
jgi:GT2 family glycosyltransferase